MPPWQRACNTGWPRSMMSITSKGQRNETNFPGATRTMKPRYIDGAAQLVFIQSV